MCSKTSWFSFLLLEWLLCAYYHLYILFCVVFRCFIPFLKCLTFFFSLYFHVHKQFYHFLLERLSFPWWNCLTPLLKIIWPYMSGSISFLSFLLHLSMIDFCIPNMNLGPSKYSMLDEWKNIKVELGKKEGNRVFAEPFLGDFDLKIATEIGLLEVVVRQICLVIKTLEAWYTKSVQGPGPRHCSSCHGHRPLLPLPSPPPVALFRRKDVWSN